MQAKKLALVAQRKSEEDKVKLDEERQHAIERADAQNSELQAKMLQLEAKL